MFIFDKIQTWILHAAYIFNESLDWRHMTFFRHLIAWHFCEVWPIQAMSDTKTKKFNVTVWVWSGNLVMIG